MQYATTSDGVSIACCPLGTGQPLVVLPSGPWASVQVESQVPACWSWYQRLAQHRQVIRYDNRGTGLSGVKVGGEIDFSLEAQVADLEATIQTLCPGRPAALLAAQTAGPAAISYAVRYPRQVSHLVLWGAYARRSDYSVFSRTDAFHELMNRDWELFIETRI